MRNMLLAITFILPFLMTGQINLEHIEIKKIWDSADHSAFTDLIYFKDKFYCSFREGSGHVPGNEDVDGTVRILESKNGEDWKSVAHIQKEGYDLRDPKLSIMPDGRLMVIIGGSDYNKTKLLSRLPHVSFSTDGKNFTKPQPIVMDPSIKTDDDWVWRVTWFNGKGYAINYQDNDDRRAYVVKTTDGINYQKVSELFVSGFPNEATIRFTDKEEMLIYVRRETQNREGLLLKSYPPYTQYTWVNLQNRVGGPNMILLPNTHKIILGTRLYGEKKTSTGLFLSDYDGNQKLLAEFPSSGDTSYPGLVWMNGYLWVSYYSSHEGKTSIYLAKIKQDDIYKNLNQ